MYRTVRERIIELGVEIEVFEEGVDIVDEKRLDTDYGFDSLGFVQLTMEVEEEFDITIEEAVLEKGGFEKMTFGEFLKIVEVQVIEEEEGQTPSPGMF